MERGEITPSHLLFSSMIHAATDDSYSSLSLFLSLSFHINTHTLIHDKAMPADTGQLWAADVPHCLRPQPCIHIRVKLCVIARRQRPRSPLQAQLLIMQCQFNVHT